MHNGGYIHVYCFGSIPRQIYILSAFGKARGLLAVSGKLVACKAIMCNPIEYEGMMSRFNSITATCSTPSFCCYCSMMQHLQETARLRDCNCLSSWAHTLQDSVSRFPPQRLSELNTSIWIVHPAT